MAVLWNFLVFGIVLRAFGPVMCRDFRQDRATSPDGKMKNSRKKPGRVAPLSVTSAHKKRGQRIDVIGQLETSEFLFTEFPVFFPAALNLVAIDIDHRHYRGVVVQRRNRITFIKNLAIFHNRPN
ncbi:MAG TPA: hypothetical protein VF472_24135 [Burkholderiaceae bacterium]